VDSLEVHVMGDVPHEGQQITGNGDNDNVFVFSMSIKLTVTDKQTHLRLPGDLANYEW
jgi:hypothetical protein